MSRPTIKLLTEKDGGVTRVTGISVDGRELSGVQSVTLRVKGCDLPTVDVSFVPGSWVACDEEIDVFVRLYREGVRVGGGPSKLDLEGVLGITDEED